MSGARPRPWRGRAAGAVWLLACAGFPAWVAAAPGQGPSIPPEWAEFERCADGRYLAVARRTIRLTGPMLREFPVAPAQAVEATAARRGGVVLEAALPSPPRPRPWRVERRIEGLWRVYAPDGAPSLESRELRLRMEVALGRGRWRALPVRPAITYRSDRGPDGYAYTEGDVIVELPVAWLDRATVLRGRLRLQLRGC